MPDVTDVVEALALVPGSKHVQFPPARHEHQGELGIATIEWGGKRLRLYLSAWNSPDPRGLSKRIEVLVGAAPRGSIPVLVAEYVAPSLRRHIEQEGVGWLDGRGNIHVVSPQVLLHVEGPTSRGSVPRPRGRLFASGNARVARALLEAPDSEHRLGPLADMSGVHMSTVSRALQRFEREGLVERAQGGWKVANPHHLVDVWLDWWAARPSSVVDRLLFAREPLSSLAHRLTQSAHSGGFRIAITGLAAAERIEPLLPATMIEAYVSPFATASSLVSALGIPVRDRGSASFRLIFSPDDGAFVGVDPREPVPVVGRAQLLLDLASEGGRADQVVRALRSRWQL